MKFLDFNLFHIYKNTQIRFLDRIQTAFTTTHLQGSVLLMNKKKGSTFTFFSSFFYLLQFSDDQMSSMLWKCSCSWERSMSIRWREFNTEPLKYHCQEEFSLQHRKVLTDTSPRARAKWQEGESSFGCTRHAIGESLGLKLFHIVSPKIRIMVHQEHWYCYYNSFR